MNQRMASIGPVAVDSTPLDKARLTQAELEFIWSIVGQSAERNLGRLPLWKVIALAYYEGAAHAKATYKKPDC